MHQGGRLKYLIDNQSMPNARLVKAAGISMATLYNYYSMEEIPSKNLKKICQVLKVDYIKVFIQPDGNSDEVKAVKRENELLREQIEQLKEMISLMKSKRTKNAI